MSFYEQKLKPLAAGAIFGAALTAAGVFQPSVIIGQMKFQDFLMLKVFLTATAASALVIPLAKHFKFTQVKPCPASSIEWFGSYDANIIGGSLLGIGMSLTGACPGTVLPQIATGIRSSLFVGIGGIVGGMLFASLIDQKVTEGKRLTLDHTLEVSQPWAILGYQAACAVMVAGASYFASVGNSLVSPMIGGVLIGVSQMANLVLTGNALGISGAYETVARWLASGLKSEQNGVKRDIRSAVFVLGVLLGSWVLSRLTTLPPEPEIGINPMSGVIGGALLIFGGRLGGGCTSGHGITGMSQLSIASFITVASMFGGGMAWAALFS